jgi:hypothetical protein
VDVDEEAIDSDIPRLELLLEESLSDEEVATLDDGSELLDSLDIELETSADDDDGLDREEDLTEEYFPAEELESEEEMEEDASVDCLELLDSVIIELDISEEDDIDVEHTGFGDKDEKVELEMGKLNREEVECGGEEEMDDDSSQRQSSVVTTLIVDDEDEVISSDLPELELLLEEENISNDEDGNDDCRDDEEKVELEMRELDREKEEEYVEEEIVDDK